MDKTYFKQYYLQERNHWWFKVRAKILMKIIRRKLKKNDLKILNVGSATHRSSELLSEFGDVQSIEYDKDCCRFVRNELGFDVLNGSATELPFKEESFDLVCAFDVIEHIENDMLAVQEMERVCKSNRGYIFITVPAFNSLWSDHDVINHHYRRYTLNNLLLIKSQKSKTIIKSYFNFFLFPFIALFRVLGKFKFGRPKKPRSDFDNFQTNKFLDSIFEFIFNFEYYLLPLLRFPFGVSILLLYKLNK